MGNQISKDIEQAKLLETAKYGTRTQRLARSQSLDIRYSVSDWMQNVNSSNSIVPHSNNEIRKYTRNDKVHDKDYQPSQNLINQVPRQETSQNVSQRKIIQFPNIKIAEEHRIKAEQQRKNESDHENDEQQNVISQQYRQPEQKEDTNRNIKFQEKNINLKKQINWGSFKLDQTERNNLTKNKTKVRQVWNLISSDEEDHMDQRQNGNQLYERKNMKQQQDESEESSSELEQDVMIDEQEEADNDHSQMLDEELERKPIKKQAQKVSEVHLRIKMQYNQKQPQQMGIFEWNEFQDLFKLELQEQEVLLLEFQAEVKQKGRIQSPHLLNKIKPKIYLKSIDALANFNLQIITNLDQLQNHQELIKIGFRNQKKYGLIFSQLWQVDNQNNQQPIVHVFGRQISLYSNQNQRPPLVTSGQKLQLVFMLAQDLIVGSSRLITNVNQAQNHTYQTDRFYESLEFLISNMILEVETTRASQSSYKFIDPNQIYLNTRGAQTAQNLALWKQKQQADYEITIPLTLNLVNYYNFLCIEKLKQPPVQNRPQQQLSFLGEIREKRIPSPIQPYKVLLHTIQYHIRTVLSYLKKSRWQETIKNDITKARLQAADPSEIQAPDQREDPYKQESDDDYDVDAKLNNLNPNQQRFSDQEVPKQELQKLFESGNWFSLHSSKIEPKNPSPYFRGQLRQFQQLTLAWMLYRQNCSINYKIDRPHEHYKWQTFRHIGEPELYKNIYTGQILNFIPIWKKKVLGGMLCDEMGLGKTVMSLALIDSHVRRKKTNPQIQAGTLIIVPTIVLTQWQAKVQEFLPHLTCCVISRGKDVKKDLILKSDIVLTTFGIILSQQKKQRKYDFGQNPYANLFDFEWFRLIVDEADNLRNQKTNSAKLIKEISKKYTWLLTGTPIQNRLSDLESYFKILGYKDHGLLKANIKKGFIKSNKSVILVKQSLKDLMVRRKKDTLDENGKPILDLKQCKWIYQNIVFTPEERQIYDTIEGIVVKQMDKIIEEDRQHGEWDDKIPRMNMKIDPSVNQGIQHVFGKLMKLRQFCCHPELLYSRSTFITYDNFPKRFEHFRRYGYDVKVLRSLKAKGRKQQKDIFQRIFLSASRIKIESQKSRVYEKIMSRESLICTKCNGVIRTGLLTPCLHLYCEDCFDQEWANSKKREKFDVGQNKFRQRKYMDCSNTDCNQRIYHRQTLQLPRFNRFNKKIQQIEPNSKINELLMLIRDKTQRHQKIVVYTHFIGMIEILEYTFKKECIPAFKLVGRDTVSERQVILKAFRQKDDIKVLIISTKCGYAGLNLEIANKLFFMDPWWNPAVEDQAMGRLHRYGQQNKVEATRFIIEKSIEEVINLMGNQKKLLSDFVLDSDCSKKRKKKVELLKFFRLMIDAKIKK